MRLLAALDPTHGDHVVAQAVAWAEILDAELSLCVVSTVRLPPDEMFGPAAAMEAVNTFLLAQEAERQHVERCLLQIPEARRGEAIYEHGDAAARIVARAADFDILVVGTHGRTGLKRLFLGSVAEVVVRRSPCPVLVVRLDGEAPSGPLLTVVAPVDGRDIDLRAVEWVEKALPDAQLDVVYAVAWVAEQDPDATKGAPNYEAVVAARARQQTQGALAKAGRPDLRAHLAARRGEPVGDAVAGYATDHRAHLIAMPSHNRTGLARHVMGSVAERTVRTAPCAVLVTRGG
jgi:nucleotide-binding universal stress UspA family protein